MLLTSELLFQAKALVRDPCFTPQLCALSPVLALVLLDAKGTHLEHSDCITGFCPWAFEHTAAFPEWSPLPTFHACNTQALLWVLTDLILVPPHFTFLFYGTAVLCTYFHYHYIMIYIVYDYIIIKFIIVILLLNFVCMGISLKGIFNSLFQGFC